MACGTLAFVTPGNSIPLLVGQVNKRLSPSIYNWISSLDVQIWKGPEGTPIIDGKAQ
jgi:hypothetical protein